MEISFKGQPYEYPTRLKEITLRQFIDYQEQVVKPNEERQKVIEEMADGVEKDMEQFHNMVETACRSISFFTGISYEDVAAFIEVSQVISLYNTSSMLLKDEEETFVQQPFYEWNNTTWVIAPAEIKPNSEMTLNEFISAKETVRQMDRLGIGFWDALPYLCAIYFRKDGEPFTENLVSAEHVQLMHTLPMDFAIAVAFFLTDTLVLFRITSASSNQESDIKEA